MACDRPGCVGQVFLRLLRCLCPVIVILLKLLRRHASLPTAGKQATEKAKANILWHRQRHKQ